MHHLKPALARAAVAAAGGLIATAATAADLPLLPEPPPPVAVESFGGWYLRGDIGVSSQGADDAEFSVPVPAADRYEVLDQSFHSAGFVGVGAGYRFNSWFRADVTGEYRARARFNYLERYDAGRNGWDFTNRLEGDKTELVGLVNAYLDLGTWWGVTPFVGAGVGVARIDIENFRDTNDIFNVVAYGADKTTTNFAWALYAGLGYEVSERLSLELAYRYLNMGDVATGAMTNAVTGFTRGATWSLDNLHSHDLKVGMRWNLQGPTPVYDGPISRSF